ncbi:MAG: ornithine cyclodeaminase family protein, partial [Mangrovicoccus sp.]
DTLLSRAAWIDGLGVAVKSVTVMPKSTPSVQGAMLVFNDQSGAIEAVIDSALVTKWKTIGDSLLGAKLLARPESKKLLVIGAGTIAEGLLEAYPTLFPGLEIDLWNRTEETAIALARKHPRTRAISDLPAAVGKADIIATATMSHQPVLSGAWLRAGQHIDLIGAFTAEMREADDTALQRSRIFVDSRATTVGHIGELMIPLASGAISEADICGDYYDLVAGGQGRTSATEITLCKNGGGAHLDLMVGREILAAYRAQST